MMKHEFDLDYLLLSLEEDATTVDQLEYFKDRFQLLVAKSHELSPTMMPVTLSNRNAFGKLKLKILSLENLACSNTFFIRVTSDPFVVTTRKIIGFDQERLQILKRQLEAHGKSKQKLFNYSINQMFYVPITSRFG